MPADPAAPSSPPKGKKENVLTRKLGPLPTWAWIAIVAVLLIGYYYMKNKQSSGSTTPTGTGAGQVPQFVNQTYTTLTPPTAPGPDQDRDHDRDKDHKPSLIPWKDEGKKDKRVKQWEHKHHTEYPFNTWMGEPTAAQLAAFKSNPGFEPLMPSQSDQWPIDPLRGVRPGNPTAPGNPSGPMVVPGG